MTPVSSFSMELFQHPTPRIPPGTTTSAPHKSLAPSLHCHAPLRYPSEGLNLPPLQRRWYKMPRRMPPRKVNPSDRRNHHDLVSLSPRDEVGVQGCAFIGSRRDGLSPSAQRRRRRRPAGVCGRVRDALGGTSRQGQLGSMEHRYSHARHFR